MAIALILLVIIGIDWWYIFCLSRSNIRELTNRWIQADIQRENITRFYDMLSKDWSWFRGEIRRLQDERDMLANKYDQLQAELTKLIGADK